MRVYLYACVYLGAQNVISWDLSSPHPPLHLLPALSSFPPKAVAAIYSVKKGETIKAGSIYQSQSDRLQSSLSTTSLF